jgi:uncharacterized protein (UPF0276 family)
MNMPGCEMTDGQFLAEIVEAADCGILLDVNNVYVNAVNHKFDPIDYLKQIPIERTVQMHVAGHRKIGEYIIDTHGAALIEPVYELLKYVLKKTDVRAVLLERDQNFPEFDELVEELNRIRAIAAEAKNSLLVSRQKRTELGIGERQPRRDAQPVKGGRDLRALSA